MNELSPWVRKLLAVALLVSLLALLWGWGIAPLYKWTHGVVEELREARFEAARLAQAVEAAKHVSEARVGELERLVSGYIVSSSSEAEAITLVQGTIDKLMKENRLVLESIQSNPPITVGTMRRIGLSLRAQGPESRVVDFLVAVEKTMPMLKLETLTLRATVPSGERASSAAPNLFVEATVVAYWRSQAAGSGK